MSIDHVKNLSLKNFTVFKDARFQFVNGINVFIGENGTGKTHLLKLMYSMLKPFDATQTLPNESPAEMKARFNSKLLGVFRPDDRQPGRLVSNLQAAGDASVSLAYGNNLHVAFDITAGGKLRPLRRSMKVTPPSLFLPSRELLAMYESFVAAYENRELAFDETYLDACKALAASPLKGDARKKAEPLLQALGRLMGGKLKKVQGRFYLEQHGRRDTEAHLLAEGQRKIATLYRLIANGALAPGSVLLFDEPEAGLNPKVVAQLAGILRALAASSIQIFLATHDFLLSHELSLASEYATEPAVATRFIALQKTKADGVVPETANSLPELETNPILQEFAAHYDREHDLVSHRLQEG